MRPIRELVVTSIIFIAALCAGATAQQPQPPIADKKPVELKKHGHVRVDEYFWLCERANPKVLAYLKAENEYTDAMMTPYKSLEEKLYRETIARIKQEDTTVPYLENGYEYQVRFEEGREYPLHCRRLRQAGATQEVILDVNDLAKGSTFCAVTGFSVNRQNDLAAFSMDTIGRNIFTLRIKDLAKGAMLPDEVPAMTGNFVWAEDGRTLFYTRQDPQTLRPYRIFRHVVGTDTAADVLVYEEKDDTFGCRVSKTRSKKFLLITCRQTVSTECRYLEAANPTGEFRVFAPRRRDHEYSVDHIGDHFYIRTNDKARNFRLMKTAENATTEEHWQVAVPHRDDVLLEDFTLFNDYLVVEERRGGLPHLRVIPWSSPDREHEIDLDEAAYAVGATPTPEADTAVLRYVYTSLTTPMSTFDYDMKTHTKTLRKRQPVLGGFDPANYVTERLWATARDKTRVPITVVYHQRVKRDGTNPCLLYGYGSYGSEMDPIFQSHLLNLLDRGFVYAIAHIRGGQILGRSWYEDGKLQKKKNTFTDFIDCGEFLIAERLADPKRLYAEGGSAGGLLMGAVINMRPDLFAGVVAHVPFVDVVTTMLDESIPLTTSEYDEWGNPNEKKYYEYILSYSPYDNVAAKAYPNLLVSTSLHDSQVQYWEPAKWVARLRAKKTGNNLLLLKTNMDAGHGGASGRFERFKLIALGHAFLLRLAGIAEAEDKPTPGWRPLPLIDSGKVDPAWQQIGYGGFSVDDGSLRTECSEKGLGLLVYRKEKFGDCQIRVVYRSKDARSNAGVYVRIDDGILKKTNDNHAPAKRDASGALTKDSLQVFMDASEKEQGPWYAVHHGYEVQICDAPQDKYSRTGAIYSLAGSSSVSDKPPTEWKTMIITLDGNRIFVDIDGKRVTTFDPEGKDVPVTREWYEPKREPKRPTTGYIGLQNHDPGDVVYFKEVSVRPLANAK
jgi:oligopeptidase B